jgi:capsule biosynthesis phosphatase
MSNTDYSNLTFVFDIDGTICPIKKKEEKYEDLVPFKSVVDKIRYYYNNGAKITLFTSRNMRTYNCDISKITEFTLPVIEEWLKKWDIPYSEIIVGKPWPGHLGFYVDDRSVRPDEFIKYSIDELNSICEISRGNCNNEQY